ALPGSPARRPGFLPATLFIAVMLGLVSSFSVPAAWAITWLNPVNGNWSDGAKWSGGVAPGPGDDVSIDNAGTFTVTLHVPASLHGLSLGASGSGAQTLLVPGN